LRERSTHRPALDPIFRLPRCLRAGRPRSGHFTPAAAPCPRPAGVVAILATVPAAGRQRVRPRSAGKLHP
jgi:hypothetical protein